MVCHGRFVPYQEIWPIQFSAEMFFEDTMTDKQTDMRAY